MGENIVLVIFSSKLSKANLTCQNGGGIFLFLILAFDFATQDGAAVLVVALDRLLEVCDASLEVVGQVRLLPGFVQIDEVFVLRRLFIFDDLWLFEGLCRVQRFIAMMSNNALK